MPPAYEYLDHAGPIAFAHRGGALHQPENSMAAFERAMTLGYRYLETDVRVTADGVLLAFHDHALNRVTDLRGRIAELSYAEVAKARIDGVEPIPRLAEVLSAWPDARVNIDVKVAAATGPLVEVLHQAKAWNRVCVASFSERRLAHLRTRMRMFTDTPVCTALGPRGVAALRAGSRGGLLGRLFRVAASGVACAQVPYGFGRARYVTEHVVAQCRALGLQLHVWTVNDPVEVNRLLDLGVDGIMTDDLVMLRDQLARRRLWPSSRAEIRS